jgi:DNA-directed RNA polymerase specialized sigma24 family protein
MEPEGGDERVDGMDLTIRAPAVGAPISSGPAPESGGGTTDIDPTELISSLRFEDFYKSARKSIGSSLALALGDVDLASDATDEAMTRAFERWPTVARLDRPEAWVYRVGFNWAVSFLRRRRRSPHRLYEPGATDGPGVADPAVHAALAELDVKHRSVVVCRHLLGWSVAETAEGLGLREGTVKSRLHRAHRILESRLGHLRDSEEQP